MWKNELRISNVPSMRSNLKKIPEKSDEDDECCKELREGLVKLNQNNQLTRDVDFNTASCEKIIEWAKSASEWARKILRGDIPWNLHRDAGWSPEPHDLMTTLLDLYNTWYRCNYYREVGREWRTPRRPQ